MHDGLLTLQSQAIVSFLELGIGAPLNEMNYTPHAQGPWEVRRSDVPRSCTNGLWRTDRRHYTLD